MRVLAIALAAVLTALPGAACLQMFGTDLRGEWVEFEGLMGEDLTEALLRVTPRAEWEAQRVRLERRAPHDWRDRSDYAVALLHLGRTNEGLAILQQLAIEHPDVYAIAANVGTAYELAGNDAAALDWLRKSVALNAKAHDGTEWLHLRILEAKLAAKRDPHWLDAHSILGLDFGPAVIPRLPGGWPAANDGTPAGRQVVKEALWYQLKERAEFVKPPDRIVGSLLFDWGNLSMRGDPLETAAALYRAALLFGTPNGDLARRRLARAEQIIRDGAARRKR